MSAEAGPLLPPPRMEPLRTVQEVMQWQPGVRPGDYFCSSSVELPRDAASVAAISVPGRPRLLVCHDMMGGYLGDALTQGCPDPDAYKVTAWALVDTFMYFSHHLCTIPPPGWTDAAHRHCTRVLGTFISEWDGGAAECARAFATAESAAALAEKLAGDWLPRPLSREHPSHDTWLTKKHGINFVLHSSCHLRLANSRETTPTP